MTGVELPPWSDVELALIHYLSQVAPADTDPETGDEPTIRILRVGGSDDGVTDFPRVEVTNFARTRNAARTNGERCRQLLLALNRSHRVDVDDVPVSVDFCRTDTPPERVPTENELENVDVSYYRLGLRRPRRRLV